MMLDEEHTSAGGPMYIGLMSGTSMDGVDGVLASFDAKGARIVAAAHCPFDDTLRAALFALQSPGDNEIEREALCANALVEHYAQCCHALMAASTLPRTQIAAIGVHGQTIRHRPERGYTRQTNNPALLAEKTGIDVIADFRSRDVAAGGQGAPLVPAFHAELFGAPGTVRVICNIGGISNVSILHGTQASRGFDCGPGNALLDGWAERHLAMPYDKDGQLASQGAVVLPLLDALNQEPFLALPPPKSTGRDLFNMAWLDALLARTPGALDLTPADVQATLTLFSAQAIARAVRHHAADCEIVYGCGGGVRNPVLMAALEAELNAVARPDECTPQSVDDSNARGSRAVVPPRVIRLASTDVLGVDPQEVESLAFAWLAMRFTERRPGNLPDVTGAAGPRILGALYPA